VVARQIRGNGAPIGEEFTVVVEEHHSVAQQAPALLRVSGDGPGGIVVRGRRRRATGYVVTYQILRERPDPCFLSMSCLGHFIHLDRSLGCAGAAPYR
jgi:hypothetical protein